ncbi:MAG: TrmH family RNA methyltransferase [Candidatus Moraniibacteriota bacterium]|nr:MAG: TrmH family RNA methyltransferase [Candidatus Moranbacteria bacterium]
MHHHSLILILDNIRSAYNVGAMFRTADGAGVEQMYLVGLTPKPSQKELYLSDAEKTLRKTALGAEKTVLWKQVKNLRPLLKRLKKDGYELVALEQTEGGIDYRRWKPKSNKVALIVGNEVEGVLEKTMVWCDQVIELPMRGKKNSLNVSVAAGIALYHLSATMERLRKVSGLLREAN